MKTTAKRAFLSTCTLALMLGTAAWAGPIVIDGTDANDIGHGSAVNGVNTNGWLYMQKVLENLGAAVTTNAAKVVVDLGSVDIGLTNEGARAAITSAFNGSNLPGKGWTLVHVDPADIASWLTSLSTDNTGILYIPTCDNASGDLDDNALSIVNDHAQEISDFVAGGGNPLEGGALFAMSESPFTAEAYGWLIAVLPDITVTDIGGGGNGSELTLTVEGEAAFPGLTSDDLSSGPWHNYFEGDFGGLEVLATAPDDQGITRNVILGGGAGTSFVPSHPFCITRPAQFWFTRLNSDDPNCVTLLKAIEANNGTMSLGFVRLPVANRNSDNTKNAIDATIEALGFYYRGNSKTGEEGGTQSAKITASKLCKERKRLAIELIAATANVKLLGTAPSNCTYTDGGVTTNFPSSLLSKARAVMTTGTVTSIRAMTTVLKKFNNSGVANAFFGDLVDCSTTDQKMLKSLARDPTTRFSCPSINDNCASAEVVAFDGSSGPFAPAVYKASASLFKMPTGRAYWRIPTSVAVVGRQFTVDTEGSTFPVTLRILQGTCSVTETNGVQISDDTALSIVLARNISPFPDTPKVQFTTDGSASYFIRVSGESAGKAKVKITSP